MGSTPKTEGGAARSRVTMLEEEGEVAADYLEEFLDIADLDGDIEIDVEHGRAALAVVAEDNEAIKHLVGREGATLEALQELTRLAVQAKTGERSRLMLDIAGYRAQRKVELGVLAKEVIARVNESGHAVTLEPMNAFERKVIHDVVTATGLVSESHGVDPNRHIEISPAK